MRAWLDSHYECIVLAQRIGSIEDYVSRKDSQMISGKKRESSVRFTIRMQSKSYYD